MSNPYYTNNILFIPRTIVRSQDANAQFNAIEEAFDDLHNAVLLKTGGLINGNFDVSGTAGFAGVATFDSKPTMQTLAPSRPVFSDALKGLVSVDITGTGNVVLADSPTINNLSCTGTPTFATAACFADGTAALPSITNTGDTNTGLFFPAADTVCVATAGLERLQIDSAGNAGLGVTPSAWGSQKALQFQYGSLSAGNALGTELVGNTFFNGTNWIYREAGTAYRYNQSSAGHSWHNAPSGIAGNPITFTQVATLFQNGNYVLGGTTDSGARLKVNPTVNEGLEVLTGNQANSTRLFSRNNAGAAVPFEFQATEQRWYNGAGSQNMTLTQGGALDVFGDVTAGVGTIGALRTRNTGSIFSMQALAGATGMAFSQVGVGEVARLFNGNLLVGTTANNLARTEIVPINGTDRYGLFVNSGVNVGGGVTGSVYGAYIKAPANNNASTMYGVYGETQTSTGAQTTYGGYFTTPGSPNSGVSSFGVYGEARHPDTNGPAVVYGCYGKVTSAGSNSNGSHWAGYFENAGAAGLVANGLGISTVAGAATVYGLRHIHAGAEVLRSLSTGNVQNQNGVYGTIASDVRVKENILPAAPKLADILELEVVNYNLIGSSKKMLGFKAHQFQTIFPSLVTTQDTRVYNEAGEVVSGYEDQLGLNVGMEFAFMVKALQEQQAIIDQQGLILTDELEHVVLLENAQVQANGLIEQLMSRVSILEAAE